jgi:hypothetical protein
MIATVGLGTLGVMTRQSAKEATSLR